MGLDEDQGLMDRDVVVVPDLVDPADPVQVRVPGLKANPDPTGRRASSL